MVVRQEKNLTLDRKLIITVCPTGGTITRRQNPYQPYTAGEIAEQVITARKIATIARELGRDIATPPEARAIMGIRS